MFMFVRFMSFGEVCPDRKSAFFLVPVRVVFPNVFGIIAKPFFCNSILLNQFNLPMVNLRLDSNIESKSLNNAFI